MKPITPAEAEAQRQGNIPDAVIAAFNAEIVSNLDLSGTAKVCQSPVVALICGAGYNRRQIFDNKWLDVEPIFRAAGWEVTFDKAVAWGGDNYDSFWIFKKKRL